MKITQLDNGFLDCPKIQYSHDDLEKEYNAHICLKIINLLKESGLINDTEKKKLQIKMIDQFTPYLSKIVSQIT